jgi:uncharacterized protein YndB with AHSA1/START domain
MSDQSLSAKNTESVERVIAAPPADIFAILADPSRHREIDGSGTVRDAYATTQQVALGDTFGMDMKMGLGYRMINTVVEFEQDRLIAWQPRPDNKLMAKLAGGRIWRYHLTPVDGGTLVRETWDISQEQHPAMVRPMRSKVRQGMTTTLERIASVIAAR